MEGRTWLCCRRLGRRSCCDLPPSTAFGLAFVAVRRLCPRQPLGHLSELGKCSLKVLDDLCRDQPGRREVRGILQRLVPQPKDVETGLIAGDQILVGERPEPFG